MQTAFGKPVVYVVKPVGVPIQKSPAPPSFDPPHFVDDDDHDDDHDDGGLSFLKALRMFLVAIVLCLSCFFLMIRRSILPDWLWLNRLQDASARIGYHQPLG
jgi:hypothetical protein